MMVIILFLSLVDTIVPSHAGEEGNFLIHLANLSNILDSDASFIISVHTTNNTYINALQQSANNGPNELQLIIGFHIR